MYPKAIASIAFLAGLATAAALTIERAEAQPARVLDAAYDAPRIDRAVIDFRSCVLIPVITSQPNAAGLAEGAVTRTGDVGISVPCAALQTAVATLAQHPQACTQWDTRPAPLRSPAAPPLCNLEQADGGT